MRNDIPGTIERREEFLAPERWFCGPEVKVGEHRAGPDAAAWGPGPLKARHIVLGSIYAALLVAVFQILLG